MKTALAKLEGISPYSQSRFHQTPKLPKELSDDYEKRTWRERCNYLTDGRLFIPQMAFKNALGDVAKFLGEKIPGRKNATWTKHFESGLQLEDDLILSVTKDEVEGEWFHVPSDGKPGGSSRVLKCFPVIREWNGELTFYIIDDTITEDVFQRYLSEAGKFIGVGRFRPQKRGFYGRFKVVDIVW
jgi:hypothetical protein